MIRKLMASTAVLALMSTGAFTIAQAQTDQTANPPVIEEQAQTAAPATEAAPTTELAASEEVLTPDQPTFATAFIGKSVYSSEDPESDNIGDINDLIVSKDGTITHAVVGVGGFLGIGEKNVAVPFDELKVVEKDGDIRLIYASTREQLEAAPALDRTAFDPAARAAAEQASTDTGAGSLAPVPAEPSQDMAAAPAEQPAPAEEQTAAAPAEQPAPAEEQTAAAPAEQPAPAEEQTAAAPAEQPAADATVSTEQEMAANAPAEANKAPAEDLTAAPANEEVAASTQTPAAAPASGEVIFANFKPDEVQATDLMGKSVYGADNKSIGEISDLILEKEGKTRVALIDVGGFLGIGEKTVGLPFDQLEIYTADDGSDQVKVAMSKEQLEQLPAMKIETAAVTPVQPLPAEQPADTMAAAPAEPAVTTEATTAEAPATTEMTTGSIATDYALATQDIAASKLIGATVYGPDDKNLGEVSDIIFAKNGDIEAAIVDVGGFLGMGEKPVAVQFGSLNVRTDENGAITVMVNATEDQLKQAPTFEKPAKTTVQ